MAIKAMENESVKGLGVVEGGGVCGGEGRGSRCVSRGSNSKHTQSKQSPSKNLYYDDSQMSNLQSMIRSSRMDDREYLARKQERSREIQRNSKITKVKVIKPQSLKSYQYLKKAEKLVLEYNLIKEDEYEEMIASHKDFDQITEKRQCQLAGITLNNLGCLYKKLKYNKVAIEYFKQVMNIELTTGAEPVSIVATMLNISAILSSIGRHKEAY